MTVAKGRQVFDFAALARDEDRSVGIVHVAAADGGFIRETTQHVPTEDLRRQRDQVYGLQHSLQQIAGGAQALGDGVVTVVHAEQQRCVVLKQAELAAQSGVVGKVVALGRVAVAR